MRAVTITADHGLEWGEHPDPVPGEYELLVAVGAAGLNGADLLQRKGYYPPPFGIPEDIPGLEMAGVVVEVGPRTSRFKEGDLVMALVGGAAQAELALTDERTAVPIPADLDLDAAGGFMEAAATAFDALFTQAGLGAGERLLVTGAAGGVGTCAVQLGEAAGATVVASTRHRELNNDLIELGALATVLPAQCAEFGPFDVILELVGGPGLADSVSCLATGGRLVVIGVGAGARVELDLHQLMQKRARIMASTMRARPLPDRALVISALERRVLPLVESGRLIVPIAATYPMTDAPEAYDRFAAGAKLGKVVLLTEGADLPIEMPAELSPEP
ncbi:MAG: zinc-binding dehydrogenase [Acidimicrobiales bacterium]